MSSLPRKIEALLCKAEADAAAARRDFSRARTLYERAWSIDPDCVEAEQLARLYFLAQDWKALESHVPFVSGGRRLVWETLLQAHEGRQANWPGTAWKREYDSAYRAWLSVLAGRTAEALEVGMDYFRTVEAGWERDFMGRTLLTLQPTQCCGCRSKPAIGYFLDRPVCADCRSSVEDESVLMKAMEGNDPETARLIENISGEPFVPQRAYDFVRVQRPPEWQSPPAEPLFEIEDSAALVELMDDRAIDCWRRALELAGQEQVSVSPRHLWQALLELPDSAYGVLVPKEVHVIRTASPVEVDLRWVLNIARWGAALFPYRVSELVSPQDLLLALTWTLPTSGRITAALRASVSGLELNDVQMGEFERLTLERPEDLYLRIMVSARGDGVGSPVALERMLWFIDRYPEYATYCRVGGALQDPDSRQAVLEAWCNSVRAQPDRVGALTAAASFFSYEQPLLTLELHLRAAELEPDESSHPFWIASSYERMAESATEAKASRLLFEKAAVWKERSIAHIVDRDERCESIYEALCLAFRAEAWDQIRRLATELLATSLDEDGSEDEVWTHQGEIALGHVAFEGGNLDAAKRHLIRSLGVDWCPEENSYTPSTELARKLLERGEQDVVLEYFSSCAQFWLAGSLFLKEWIEQVEAGKVPDFSLPPEVLCSTEGYRNFDRIEPEKSPV